MARQEVGVRTVAAASGAAYVNFVPGSGRPMRLLELGVSVVTATASGIGLGLAANTPVASTTTLGESQDNAAALGGIGTVWSTAPTVPAKFKRRFLIPATIGLGFIWRFDNPGILIPDQKLTVWNFHTAAGGALDLYAVWDE